MYQTADGIISPGSLRTRLLTISISYGKIIA